jgi:hypothetical protein
VHTTIESNTAIVEFRSIVNAIAYPRRSFRSALLSPERADITMTWRLLGEGLNQSLPPAISLNSAWVSSSMQVPAAL